MPKNSDFRNSLRWMAYTRQHFTAEIRGPDDAEVRSSNRGTSHGFRPAAELKRIAADYAVRKGAGTLAS